MPWKGVAAGAVGPSQPGMGASSSRAAQAPVKEEESFPHTQPQPQPLLAGRGAVVPSTAAPVAEDARPAAEPQLGPGERAAHRAAPSGLHGTDARLGAVKEQGLRDAGLAPAPGGPQAGAREPERAPPSAGRMEPGPKLEADGHSWFQTRGSLRVDTLPAAPAPARLVDTPSQPKREPAHAAVEGSQLKRETARAAVIGSAVGEARREDEPERPRAPSPPRRVSHPTGVWLSTLGCPAELENDSVAVDGVEVARASWRRSIVPEERLGPPSSGPEGRSREAPAAPGRSFKRFRKAAGQCSLRGLFVEVAPWDPPAAPPLAEVFCSQPLDSDSLPRFVG